MSDSSVVHRLPLEGKLSAMPRLRKRPAATTDEVGRKRFPNPSSNYIPTFHLIPPLRGDLPLKGKAVQILRHLRPPYTRNAPFEIISQSCAGFPLRGSCRRCRVSERDRQRRLMRWVENASSIPTAIILQLSTSFPHFAGTFPSRGRLAGCFSIYAFSIPCSQAE